MAEQRDLNYFTPGSKPKRIHHYLIWWLPPAAAVLVALAIVLRYPDVGSRPRFLYEAQLMLLQCALWWLVIVAVVRVALWARRTSRENPPQ